MYLHIGKNYIIKEKDVICILNIETLKWEFYKDFLKTYKEKITDISGNNARTLIITKEKEDLKIYISNILPTTIAGRVK